MPPATLSATGKKQEIAPIATLEPGPDPEPHDHDREEDDLGTGTEIVEIGLVGARHELAAAEQNADREPAHAADQHGDADLVECRVQMEIEGGVDEGCIERFTDRDERGHDVAVEQPDADTASQITTTATMMAMRSAVTGRSGSRSGLAAGKVQSAGLSHRSSLSIRMNTQMLTRMTKQIAA